MNAPDVGSRWRHVRRGTVYAVLHNATMQAQGLCLDCHSRVDGAPVVVYQGENGRVWVRPLVEFLDGRFVEVDDG